jgi:hypothetical protein
MSGLSNILIKRDFSLSIDKIREIYEKQAVIIEGLEKENKFLREQYNKDEEVSELKTEILNMKQQTSNAFVLNEKETKAIADWIENHNKEFHNGKPHCTSIGRIFSYTFTPTSIGSIGEITCICGQTFCFRDLR